MIKVHIDLSKATKEELDSYLASDLYKVLMSGQPIPVPQNWTKGQYFTVKTTNPPFDANSNKFEYGEQEQCPIEPMEQFNPDVYMLNEQDEKIRLINHPLDEVYLVDEIPSSVTGGMLPYQEFEVRKAVIAMLGGQHLEKPAGFFKQIIKKANVATQSQLDFQNLVNSSPEHKAALRRIISTMPKDYKSILARYAE
ncbi:hypothetical protein [Acinetobacter nosocomialis]|uniref:hypothetical protein n=1 Tax=Acinetobacter nosocomialis TaxID=106654 RepID=UPI001F209232|nr:hypothetical protein [Acinetobacter nosocomialis]MCE7534211.1 hypothetical protein [Acinetobacter nosocomialis]